MECRTPSHGDAQNTGIYEHYKMLIENMSEGVLNLAEDGTITFCNSRFAQFVCVPETAAIGKALSDFVAPQWKSRFSTLLHDAHQEPARCYLRLITGNGCELAVQLSVRKLADAPYGAFCAIVTDVSQLEKTVASLQEQVQQRMKTEEQLRETQRTLETRFQERTAQLDQSHSKLLFEIDQRTRAEAKFRNLVESSTIGIIIADLHGRIYYANSAMLEMTGYTGADVDKGLVRWDTMTPPEHVENDKKAVAQLLDQGISTTFEKVYIRKDGTRIPVLVSANIIEYVNGEPLAATFVTDLRQLKWTQRALFESESRLRLAIEAAQLGTWEFNHATGELLWSAQARQIFELPQDEQIDYHTFLSFVHPEDRQRLCTITEAGFARGQNPAYACNFKIVTRSGSVKHIESRGQVMYENSTDHAASVRIIGTFRDVTEFNEAQEKLKQLNETLEQRVISRTALANQRAGQLRKLAAQLTEVEQRERKRLAEVLHDHIQQLLAAAKMKTSMLKSTVYETSTTVALGQIIDLLTQSIAASRSLSIDLYPPCLHESGLLTAIHWIAHSMNDKHGLHVQVDAHSTFEHVSEDIKIVIFQIVRELLFNIVKHAGVSQANIGLHTTDNEVIVTVADQGKGFDYGSSETSNGPGSFGLFSIRERVEYLGGCFDLRSSPGKGTKICFIIPSALTPNSQINHLACSTVLQSANTGWLWNDTMPHNPTPKLHHETPPIPIQTIGPAASTACEREKEKQR